MFDRIFGHWKSSLTGILLAVAVVAAIFSQQGVTLGTAGTGTVVGLVGACAVALAGLLMKDSGTATKLPCVVLLFLFAGIVNAQTLSTQATASAFKYQGNWAAGTEQTQSFPVAYFGAQKGHVLSLGAREIIAPSTFSAYGVMGNYQPDLSKLIAKTTFSPDQFNLSIDVMGGIATLPNGITKPALEGRLNVNYAFTPNVAMTGAYAGGGLIGSDRFVVVSAGLQYRFGAQNVQSFSVKRMLKRQAARKLAMQVSGGL